jgi:hypothetical protein
VTATASANAKPSAVTSTLASREVKLASQPWRCSMSSSIPCTGVAESWMEGAPAMTSDMHAALAELLNGRFTVSR